MWLLWEVRPSSLQLWQKDGQRIHAAVDCMKRRNLPFLWRFLHCLPFFLSSFLMSREYASLQSILHSCKAASLPQTISFHAKFSDWGFSLCHCSCAPSGWYQNLLYASSWFYALLLCSFYFFSLLFVSLCFVYVSIAQLEAVRWFSLTEASNEMEWWK